jgi:hypothetical protein
MGDIITNSREKQLDENIKSTGFVDSTLQKFTCSLLELTKGRHEIVRKIIIKDIMKSFALIFEYG